MKGVKTMKNTYFSPELIVIDIQNEDVLTIISGGTTDIDNILREDY